MPELAKKWSKELYPDLEKAGGLPQALQPFLERLPGGLTLGQLDTPFIVYGRVETPPRSSQVMIAAHHRAFSADFWNQGVQYGSGWTRSLEEVAAAIHGFQVERLDVEGLESRFPWVTVQAEATVHERGPAAFVADAWRSYADWFEKEPPESHYGRLSPLLEACLERPRLYRLMPYTSLNQLCLSRTTGYPYTSECPPAFPVGEGRFRLGHGPAPHEGDAAGVALALEAALATDCPAAFHGTTDDLDADPTRVQTTSSTSPAK